MCARDRREIVCKRCVFKVLISHSPNLRIFAGHGVVYKSRAPNSSSNPAIRGNPLEGPVHISESPQAARLPALAGHVWKRSVEEMVEKY